MLVAWFVARRTEAELKNVDENGVDPSGPPVSQSRFVKIGGGHSGRNFHLPEGTALVTMHPSFFSI